MAWCADEPSLAADRVAIEQVYYSHRLGIKPKFEETLTTTQIAKLVALEVKKEAVLKRVYGVEISSALIDADVKRIDAITRAPEVLAELKAALGNDPVRFARSMARLIVVERTLRARFENDDQLHAPERGKVQELRKQLTAEHESKNEARLAIVKTAGLGDASEVTWPLVARPPEDRPAQPSVPAAATENRASSGAYSIEATAQVAQVLSPPEKSALERERALYFEDLPPDLQIVLRAQLQRPGDVSAVIESTPGFLVYIEKNRTAGTLSVSVFSVPKWSYEEWLAKQPDS